MDSPYVIYDDIDMRNEKDISYYAGAASASIFWIVVLIGIVAFVKL